MNPRLTGAPGCKANAHLPPSPPVFPTCPVFIYLFICLPNKFDLVIVVRIADGDGENGLWCPVGGNCELVK
jgi:hypothetical protein